MSRSRICTGELEGCRPTLEELSNLWNLALKGFDSPDKEVELVHFIKDRERVRQKTLIELIREAGEPALLDNLTLKAHQDSPLREVEIKIGPGRATSVTVEAEDHTWSIGRHSEIMEKLLHTRKWYALGDRTRPEWPKGKKRRGVGELAKDFLLFALQMLISIPALLALLFFFALLIAVPAAIVRNIIDPRHNSVTGFVATAFPLELIFFLVVGISWYTVIKNSRSAVVVRAEPIITPLRLTIIATTTTVIGTVVAIVAAMRK
ncbi:hypothetical protein [Actinomadura montaniterrae]|uniref:Uncharacterized protein n=1 Tax=Actinomadura montaniterrae TaxID=1803903 RepID=A0A6L3W108_9ACTN|nr:hypothetical protein [Actinomadura montaniterrae]KAB2380660.1 hypothetical protein F9B16_17305 [Actinomadura montaniterrae]